MAKISGALGTATIGSEFYITGWTIEIVGEAIDVTDSSDTTWKTFIPSGFTSWSGTFEGFQETGTADPTAGSTAAELTLELDASRNYVGNAIITLIGTSLSVAGAEAVTKTYAFQGTGSLLLTNA